MIPVLGFLIFFYLQLLVFILAATVLFGFHLFHAAFATGMRFLNRKVPVYQAAHAIMQVYRGAYRGTQVKDGQYGNQEFLHDTVKVYCFFGNGFIKFRGTVIEFRIGTFSCQL